MARTDEVGTAFDALREHALSYPQTREDHPWGETVVKVRDKVFVFLGRPEEGLSFSVKLPTSAPFAFDLPYCEPTGYGLGKAGWVTARFKPREAVPVEMLERWIDESYRAVAPKKLAAQIRAGGLSRRSPGTAARRAGARARARSARGRS